MQKRIWLVLLSLMLCIPAVQAQELDNPEVLNDTPTATAGTGDSTVVKFGLQDNLMAQGAEHLITFWRLRYTFWIEQRSAFPVDTPSEGTEVEDGTLGLQQIDAHMSYSWADWGRIEVGFRAAQSKLFGKQSSLGGDEVNRHPEITEPDATFFLPRALFAEFITPVGLVRVGHQTSHWGLGMLANDSVTQRPLDIFNNRTEGDIVERILFATKPAGLAGPIEKGSLLDGLLLGIGFDVVFRDEIASILEGDLAFQGLISLMLRDEIERKWEVGLYSVARGQTDDDGDHITIGAVNLFGRISGDLSGGAMPLEGELALESTWLFGVTNRLTPEESPEEAGVNAFGLAFEGLLRVPDPDITFGLKGGLSTGDANLDDPTLYRFSFDPDFKAGLILFDQIMLETTARSYEKATDPERSAVPPKGVENLISQGAVNSTLFLNPMIIYHPIPEITLAVGGLWARATAPLVDPIETFRNGGEPHNPFGVATDERSLGFELDLLLSYTYDIALTDDYALPLFARAEYGTFFFGGAFVRPDGTRPDNVHYVSAQVAIGW